MIIIKLTLKTTNKSIYINTEHIGHIVEPIKKSVYTTMPDEIYTNIGVTTHNDGGFKVIETPEEILKQIGLASTIEKD
jgi:hypothetical protein